MNILLECWKKRLAKQMRVVNIKIVISNVHEFAPHNLKSFLLESSDYSSRQSTIECIGFDEDERLFKHHSKHHHTSTSQQQHYASTVVVFEAEAEAGVAFFTPLRSRAVFVHF